MARALLPAMRERGADLFGRRKRLILADPAEILRQTYGLRCKHSIYTEMEGLGMWRTLIQQSSELRPTRPRTDSPTVGITCIALH